MKDYYLQHITDYGTRLAEYKKRQSTISWLRGGVFVLILYAIFGLNTGVAIKLGAIGVLVLIFLFLVQKAYHFQRKVRFYRNLVQINEAELKALDLDIAGFDSGKNFTDTKHDFGSDLDFFGESSIFQYINRCQTQSGKKNLANKLKRPFSDKQQIEQAQQAVAEIGEKIDWRQEFLAQSMQIAAESDEEKKLSHLLSQDLNKEFSFFSTKWGIKYLPALFFVLFAGSFVLAAMNIVSFSLVVLIVLLQFGVMGLYIKRISGYHAKVSKLASVINYFTLLFDLFENENFDSEYFKGLKSKLSSHQVQANVALARFGKIARAFDNRLNFIFIILANLLVYWDLLSALRLEKWQKEFGKDMPNWFEVIFEVEAFISMGNFAKNHAEISVYPAINEAKKVVRFKNLKHVLIDPKKVVSNSIDLQGETQIGIVTGANMAGKSTFLRTVGTSLVLGLVGLPIIADEAEVFPFKVFTSIRTNDSLQDNESYFYAELLRLKQIIDLLEQREPLFVIVDEMLRGTNSVDKHKGSEGFIKQLNKLKTYALVATHDVALGKLQQEMEGEIQNLKFEIEIIDNQLKFDYKLQSGVSQNMNAHFLMKQMHIIQE